MIICIYLALHKKSFTYYLQLYKEMAAPLLQAEGTVLLEPKVELVLVF